MEWLHTDGSGWMVMATGHFSSTSPAANLSINTVEEACVIIRVDFRETCGCLPILLCDSRPKLTLMKSVTADSRNERNTFLPVVSSLARPYLTQLSLHTLFLGTFKKLEK